MSAAFQRIAMTVVGRVAGHVRSFAVRFAVVVCVAGWPPGASAEAIPIDQAFERARGYYDEARYAEAVQVYEDILASGVQAPELLYNLGNAYYRRGDMGRAILNYKRALQRVPRDRDVRHNLSFVLQEIDALHAEPTWLSRGLRLISLSEWSALAVAGWWLLAFYAGLWLWGRWPAVGRVGGMIMVALWGVALAGVAQWFVLQWRPEAVVVQPGQEALFAPMDRATAHFSLPEGSIVRIDSESEGWYRVRVGEKDGWIRTNAVEPVTP